MLRRATADIARAVPAFWDAPSLPDGRARLHRHGPRTRAAAAAGRGDGRHRLASSTLEATGRADSQLTRRLRDALHRGLAHLQWGQVLLASVGSTAPFVGLFGTVWGIYHALAGMAAAGSISIDKVSGPIGEALIMTAAGIAVAVPAVLAYNVFGKWVASCEAELEGFAHDLRELVLDGMTHRDRHAATTRRAAPLTMAFGRLERNPGSQPMSEINMTPLIDVMLVLLVIFIITAPLMSSSLKLDLPKADSAAASDTAAFVALAIDAQGRLYLGEQLLGASGEREQIAQRVRAAAQRDPATEVQLRADSKVPYGRVAELIGWIQAAGLNRIGFVTEAPTAPPVAAPAAAPR